MGRRKKETPAPVTEKVELKKEKTGINKTVEKPVFQVVTYEDVYLRRKPFVTNDNKVLAGKMNKGQIYDVMAEINFSVKKMYRLKEGYYIIADEKIKRV